MSTLLYIIILLPITGGLILYLLPEKFKKIIGLSVQLVVLIISTIVFVECRESSLTIALGNWKLPVGISMYADNLSSVLVMLVSLLFMSYMIYCINRDYANKLLIMLYMMLQSLLSGIFLMDDLFSIFVLVEVSTIIVALLIMHKRDGRSMYDGMLYLLVNIFSMQFYLVGLKFLYKYLGTFSIQEIGTIIPTLETYEPLYVPYALIITAVSLKSALMPLFSWLPKAHGTPSSPSIVGAALSSLYVKGGIYLFIRFTTAFYVIDTTKFFLISGIITAVVGFIFAISQRSIKLILSYSTVSQLGLIMIAFSLGNHYGYLGGVYHIINHAIFKGLLFLCAGIIIDQYGTKDINKIRGLFKKMPIVSICLIIGILGMTGAPLFNGSISKYLIAHGANNLILTYILLFINFGTGLTYVKFINAFRIDNDVTRSKIPMNRQIILVFLSVLCLVGGIFGEQIMYVIFNENVYIDSGEYLYKSIIYVVTMILAYLVYSSGFINSTIFKKAKALDFSFNTIALSIPLFFVSLLIYLYI